MLMLFVFFEDVKMMIGKKIGKIKLILLLQTKGRAMISVQYYFGSAKILNQRNFTNILLPSSPL